ncbi:MAG: high frequency lysogenization protein HflD [Gammaproteobacteria bacterium]|nr:high frequency lysogenization protein HflD [Gammaproteobacteria bacterium]
MSNFRDKTLALAGIFQATALVKNIAVTGLADKHDFEICIRSIFETDPENVEAVYGQVEYLRTGLTTLIEQLGEKNTQRDIDIARYVISLLHLQRKLSRNKAILDAVANGIERARRQTEHFHITHENVIANLADIYSETISQIPPKIMVSGETHYLSNPDQANKIRALLLAGMRSAVLWAQLGGSRWQILLRRRRFSQEAERILKQEIQRQLH